MDKLIIKIDDRILEVAPKSTESKSNWNDAMDKYKDNSKGWRLPTKDELNEIHLQLAKKGLGEFAYYYYWSSSESGDYNAWGQDLDTGLQCDPSKDGDLYVRAVRILNNLTIKPVTKNVTRGNGFPYLNVNKYYKNRRNT